VDVEHGDLVTEGEKLVQLRNKDLQVARTDVLGQRNTVRQRIRSIHHTLREARNLTVEEQSRLTGELAELEQRLQSLDNQIALYQEKLEDLTARSPIKGQVVTWELEKRLIRRPVQRGQALLRVADPNGPWQLELHVPEDRLGHIAKAQKQRYDELRSQLRETIEEQSPELAPSQIDARLDAVADAQLTSELRDVRGPQLLTRLQVELRDLLSLPDEAEPGEQPGVELAPALWSVLSRVLNANTYTTARENLAKAVDQFPDAPLRPDFKELLDDGLDWRLPVEFVLATDPGSGHEGRIREIDLSAEVRGEEGNTVLIKVAVDKEVLPHLRPGAGASAKIYCGRAAIGYVYLYPVLEFIQSEVLFRFF
jgi:hypothetical protein